MFPWQLLCRQSGSSDGGGPIHRTQAATDCWW